MTATIQTLLLLLAVLVVVAIIARRFNTAPSILLVVAGILLALTPGLPRIELAPELVLFGILPPLIYSAGVAMSWREFRFNCARSRCWHSVTSYSPPVRLQQWRTGCWACRLPSPLCSAPLWHQPTRSRRCLSCANWAFRVGLLSFLKEKVSQTTPRP